MKLFKLNKKHKKKEKKNPCGFSTPSKCPISFAFLNQEKKHEWYPAILSIQPVLKSRKYEV